MAAKKLHHDLNQVKQITVFGSGKQGKYHILMMAQICASSVEKILVVNRTMSNSIKLIEELCKHSQADHCNWPFVFTESSSSQAPITTIASNSKRIIVLAAHSTQQQQDNEQLGKSIISNSQIICTTTNSSTPLFEGKYISKGTHINCIGSYTPKMQEVDEETIVKSKCVGDIAEHVWSEAGDFLIPLEKGLITKQHILASLGTILLSEETLKSVRGSADDITLFKSCGVALQDVALGNLVVKRAQELNLGTVTKL